MSRSAAALLAASFFTPAVALACAGPGASYLGTAVLRDAQTTSYLVNKDDGLEWANLSAPWSERSVVAHYDPGTVDVASGWSGRAPVMKLSPSGTRQILWVPDSTSFGLYSLDANGAEAFEIPSATQVSGFDAVFDASGEAELLVSTDYDELHLLTRSFSLLGGDVELAHGDATACTNTALALLPGPDDFLGMCGDHPITRSGNQLVVGDSLLGKQPLAIAGTRDGNAAVFFAVSASADSRSMSIDRLVRDGGAWSTEHVVDLPLGQLEDDETISVASPNVVAIVGETSDTYEAALYVVRAQGAGWIAEPAGRVDYSDRVSAIPDGDTATVLTGSIVMRLHSHRDAGWETLDLGRIGHEEKFYACSVGGFEALPALGPVLLGAASVLAFALRRKRD